MCLSSKWTELHFSEMLRFYQMLMGFFFLTQMIHTQSCSQVDPLCIESNSLSSHFIYSLYLFITLYWKIFLRRKLAKITKQQKCYLCLEQCNRQLILGEWALPDSWSEMQLHRPVSHLLSQGLCGGAQKAGVNKPSKRFANVWEPVA